MTFSDWLKSQKDRKDAIGDLARAAAADEHAPRGDAGLAHWKEHLEDQQARSGAVRALEEAWRMYSVMH